MDAADMTGDDVTDEESKHPCQLTEAIQALRKALLGKNFRDYSGKAQYALGAMEQHATECAHKERFIERIPELLSQAVNVWFEIDRAQTQAKAAAAA